jgi:CheY-like chemotaxis protein
MVRVIIVEDDTSFRIALGLTLRRMGADVLAEVPDGQAALEWLARQHPDLILTDCQMPRLDGIALVRRLRARGDQTPVIMISGQTESRVIDVALKAGVNQYLAKPLSTPMLQAAIERTLPGRASGGGGAGWAA